MNYNIILEDEFDDQFEKLINDKTSFIAYFHGGYNEETGSSWCSDCDIAKPIINKVIEHFQNIKVFKFTIKESKDWKKPDYKYRIHPKVKLAKVPTLIYYEKGIEFGRMIEEELFNKDNVFEFVSQITI